MIAVAIALCHSIANNAALKASEGVTIVLPPRSLSILWLWTERAISCGGRPLIPVALVSDPPVDVVVGRRSNAHTLCLFLVCYALWTRWHKP